MTLIQCASPVLPDQLLPLLRDSVVSATDPGKMGDVSPYHLTFWYDLAAEPRNMVERLVRRILSTRLPGEVRANAVGVEWWLGRLDPPYATNFEFGVHRDFGEHPESGALDSPLLSSVLYLTTVDDGPLVVFPGQPDMSAPDREHIFPQENTFAMFPGHLWHAVLSREEVLGTAPENPCKTTRVTVLVNWWPFRPSSEATAPMKLVAATYDGSIYPELRIDN